MREIDLRHMSNRRTMLLLLAAVGLIGLLAAVVSPRGGRSVTAGRTVELVVPRGSSLHAIAGLLAREGLIERPRWFIFQAMVRGEEKRFKAGRYLIESGASAGELRRMLIEGATSPYSVTIPEGLKLDEVAALWAETGLITAEDFLADAGSAVLAQKYGLPGPSLEGYLYPDTYEVEKGVSAGEIIDLQMRRLKQVFTPEMGKRAETLGMTPHQIIILASIIEKEAKLAHERPIISAVFHNRLNRRYPLESCATVIYALGHHKPKLSYRDLKIESPYNTYRFRGLPKGPICSPGLSSIMAALYPADVDYLFFVANGDGSHTFTRKKAQHDQMRYLFNQNS